MNEPDERPETRSDTRHGAVETEAGASDRRQLVVDQTASDVDHAVSDADQTASDGDQAASDRDQRASDRDQAQAKADQATSDRDQAAADSEREARASRGEDNGVYEAARADRLKGTFERDETGWARAQTTADRVEQSAWRDESARLRDLSASARDRAAEQRDIAAARLDVEHSVAPPLAENAREYASDMRARAAAERARAAADRREAAADRSAAERDRAQLRAELRRSQLDPLTGALGRDRGMVVLEHEMNRARHGNGSLVLAFVDVDELKQVNDRRGHAAGDALLQDVVIAMREHLRSYDPIVRIGGDEFVCALVDCTPDDADRRFQEVRAAIKETQPAASISVGFAPLCPHDTLEKLTERGDIALYAVKQSR